MRVIRRDLFSQGPVLYFTFLTDWSGVKDCSFLTKMLCIVQFLKKVDT